MRSERKVTNYINVNRLETVSRSRNRGNRGPCVSVDFSLFATFAVADIVLHHLVYVWPKQTMFDKFGSIFKT